MQLVANPVGEIWGLTRREASAVELRPTNNASPRPRTGPKSSLSFGFRAQPEEKLPKLAWSQRRHTDTKP